MEWKTFNVVGIMFKDKPTDKMRRIDKISRYSKRGSKFGLLRDPANEHDFNAIEVWQYFKNGGGFRIGYVPKELAKELAPKIDAGWEPNVRYNIKFIDKKFGDCKGLQLRYEDYQNG